MIKLKHLLSEYREVHGLDTWKKSGTNYVLWRNGVVSINPDAQNMDNISMAMVTGNVVNMHITNGNITIQDYDDYSSFKSIVAVQQAVKDLIRLKLTTPSKKLNITLTDLGKNLGTTTVRALLDYDASYANKIPKAFHGTTTRDLQSIKRIGIVPPSKIDHEFLKWDAFYAGDSPDNVYLSTDFSRAKYYAEHAAGVYKRAGIKTTPVVIQIDDLPIDNVVADDDFKTNMSMMQLIAVMRTGKPINPNSYMQSIRTTSQFGYKGRIPASRFTKIHKV